jgi:short-subunit dehydrogenase
MDPADNHWIARLAIEIDRSEHMRLVDINLRALTELALRFLPGMVARGRGGVINVSSIASYAASSRG